MKEMAGKNLWEEPRQVFLLGGFGAVFFVSLSLFIVSCSTEFRKHQSVHTSETLKRVMIVPGLLEDVTIQECMQLAVDALNASASGGLWTFDIVPDFKYQTVSKKDFDRKQISANISSKVSVADFLHYVSTAGRVGFDLQGKRITVFGF